MLQSWNIQQVASYIRTKHAFLEQHNAFERSDRLTFLGNRHAFAERLDKDVVAASLAAERKTHRIRELDWI
jgi:PleD family two-component response regulator